MRYLPHTDEEISEMLKVAGADSLEDLFTQIPKECCRRLRLALPEAKTEWELNAHMDRLAGRTASAAQWKNYMGAGSYEHYIPAVLSYLMGRGEFVTSYTPYQPEISQGTLQGIYEYQTLAARLLGLEVANASMYDGASALAEALLMACRITRKTVCSFPGPSILISGKWRTPISLPPSTKPKSFHFWKTGPLT